MATRKSHSIKTRKRARIRPSNKRVMTKRKPRNVGPHTMNASMSARNGRNGETCEEQINVVLDKYSFDEDARPKIHNLILQAVTNYDHSLEKRKNAQDAPLQRDDRKKLIKCMKDLDKRLDPWNLPQPLLNATKGRLPLQKTTRGLAPWPRQCYRRKAAWPLNLQMTTQGLAPWPLLERAEGSVIRDVRLRLFYLQKIFENTQIPVPTWTNPGKPERDRLLKDVEKIFNRFTKDSYAPSVYDADDGDNESPAALKKKKRRDRKQFVRDVSFVFNIKPPR